MELQKETVIARELTLAQHLKALLLQYRHFDESWLIFIHASSKNFVNIVILMNRGSDVDLLSSLRYFVVFIIAEKERARGEQVRRRVGVMRDKGLKLEEVEASQTGGGGGTQGEGSGEEAKRFGNGRDVCVDVQR